MEPHPAGSAAFHAPIRMTFFVLHDGDANGAGAGKAEVDDIGKAPHESATDVAGSDHSAPGHGGDKQHLPLKGLYEFSPQTR